MVLRSPRIDSKPKVPAVSCHLVPLIGAQTASTTQGQRGPGDSDLYLCGHLTAPLVACKDLPAVLYPPTECLISPQEESGIRVNYKLKAEIIMLVIFVDSLFGGVHACCKRKK